MIVGDQERDACPRPTDVVEIELANGDRAQAHRRDIDQHDFELRRIVPAPPGYTRVDVAYGYEDGGMSLRLNRVPVLAFGFDGGGRATRYPTTATRARATCRTTCSCCPTAACSTAARSGRTSRQLSRTCGGARRADTSAYIITLPPSR